MSKMGTMPKFWRIAKKYSDKEMRTHCLRNVGVALPLTAAVAGDRAVFALTLELEQTYLKKLRF